MTAVYELVTMYARVYGNWCAVYPAAAVALAAAVAAVGVALVCTGHRTRGGMYTAAGVFQIAMVATGNTQTYGRLLVGTSIVAAAVAAAAAGSLAVLEFKDRSRRSRVV